MLNRTKLLVMMSVSLLFAACSSQNVTIINITNPTDLNLKDALVATSIDSKLQNVSLKIAEEEIPFQMIKEDGISILKFVTDLAPKQTKEVRLVEAKESQPKEFKARTYAELSMKDGECLFR